nr:isoform 2 of clustered mitochondria protein [Quercus suber]
MTPADVAENLMPKSQNEDAETCLKKLIEAIKTAKEEATKKAEEEARLKAEEEEKEKQEATQEDVKVDESSAKDVKENGVDVVKDDKTLGKESVLPGILQGDKSDSVLYGSVDNGKKICWNDDFHSKMREHIRFVARHVLEAAKRLHLKEHTVLDGSGNVFKLAAPVECKGIVGSDDSHYLLDLMRILYLETRTNYCLLPAQAAERSKFKSEGDAHVTTDSSTVAGVNEQDVTKEGRDENVKDCASSQAETEPHEDILFNPNVLTEFKFSGSQEEIAED